MSRSAKTRLKGGGPGGAVMGAAGELSLVLRRLAWIVGVIAFAFVVLSMFSFDAADPPGHSVAPGNDPPVNWCGRAGAVVGYHALSMFGMGAWVLVAAWGTYLFITAFIGRIPHPAIRVIGAVVMAGGVAAGQALTFPDSGPVPGLGGGLIGHYAVEELRARFNTLGTLLWIVAAFAVGATVALDAWVVILPRLAWRTFRLGAKPVRAAAAAGAGAVRGRWEERMAERAREERLGARAAGRGVKKNEDEPETIPEEAGGLGATESFDPEAGKQKRKLLETSRLPDPPDDDEDVAEDAPRGRAPRASDEDADEAENEAPGAPQVYTPDELRAKIAKLPVRFASRVRTTATEKDMRDIQNVAELEGYKFPPLDLLENPEENFNQRLEELVREQAEALEEALREYRISGEVVGIESGPVITLYDVRLAPGTKVSALSAVSSDIARALKAINIRIVPNQVGRDTVGVEVPNPTKEKVRLKELMGKTESYAPMKLPMFLGKDASGEPLIEDLAKMPHMLIAGTTGSGKSVCMNTIILGFLFTKKPNELKLVLVDPKMVEMSQFKDIPHLMCPVVTEMGKAAAILEWATRKMDERYELLAEAGVRDLASYNALPWEELKARFNPKNEEDEARIPKKLPYIVFVIDELADLMITNKEVESSIVRIAQKARAVGIHLILATQRPQANVVTGLIKSNMPARISFKVASGMDSRIVLDQKGGELLLGQGDMLYLSPRSSKLSRAQGTLVDDSEIRGAVRFLKDIAAPSFERSLMQIRSGSSSAGGGGGGGGGGGTGGAEGGGGDDSGALAGHDGIANAQQDPLFDKAVEIVLETQKGSVSMLQRRLAIGYTRSSRLMDALWKSGIVGDHKGTVDRDVLISLDEWHAMKAQAEADAAAAEAPAPSGDAEPADDDEPAPVVSLAGNTGAETRGAARAV
ncbi:MAG: DNA translocase FtsK [Phycisphaerae bacterium]|nr:DNA translocase FtsK [Phycisphaerae bacterium]